MTFTELPHWLLKHVIKVLASRQTNPEVSYSMGTAYGVLNGEGVNNCNTSIDALPSKTRGCMKYCTRASKLKCC